MNHLKNVVFAFGAGGQYFFNAPARWAYEILPQVVQDLIKSKELHNVTSCAFGTDPLTYFVCYEVGGRQFRRWCLLPPELDKWLKSTDDHPNLRVVLGPSNSFFALESNACRWGNLPKALEEVIQDWLGSTGWRFGPPSFVSLGMDDSFIIFSQSKEKVAWNLASGYPTLNAVVENWIKSMGKDEMWKALEYVYLHPFERDSYIVIGTTGLSWIGGKCSMIGDMGAVGTSILDPLMAQEIASREQQANQEAREKASRQAQAEKEAIEQAERQKAERTAKMKAAREAKKVEEKDRKDKEAAITREIQHLYQLWDKICKYSMSVKASLTSFPHPPMAGAHCTCLDLGCNFQRTGKHGLNICVHDLERLLHADADYSEEWLKEKRCDWHPDKWSRVPDDVREDFQAKADEMFKLYGLLIDAAQGKK